MVPYTIYSVVYVEKYELKSDLSLVRNLLSFNNTEIDKIVMIFLLLFMIIEHVLVAVVVYSL